MADKPKTLIFFGPRDDAETLGRKLRDGTNLVLLREATVYMRETEPATRVIVMQSVSASCEAAIRKLYPNAERLSAEVTRLETRPQPRKPRKGTPHANVNR